MGEKYLPAAYNDRTRPSSPALCPEIWSGRRGGGPVVFCRVSTPGVETSPPTGVEDTLLSSPCSYNHERARRLPRHRRPAATTPSIQNSARPTSATPPLQPTHNSPSPNLSSPPPPPLKHRHRQQGHGRDGCHRERRHLPKLRGGAHARGGRHVQALARWCRVLLIEPTTPPRPCATTTTLVSQTSSAPTSTQRPTRPTTRCATARATTRRGWPSRR